MQRLNSAWIWPGSVVVGDVELGEDTNVWPFVSIRGDVAPIRVGKRCSIQDQVTLHCRHTVPLEIGDDVVVGHQACVHCRRVEDGALIGIGAKVLDNAIVGEGALVAAGAVVTPGTIVEAGMVYAGVPAKPLRPVSDQEREWHYAVVARYVDLARNVCSSGPRPGVEASAYPTKSSPAGSCGIG